MQERHFNKVYRTFQELSTEKTVSLIQRKISLIYGQRKNFFDLEKVLLIQKNVL